MTENNIFVSKLLEGQLPNTIIDGIITQYCEADEALKSIAAQSPNPKPQNLESDAPLSKTKHETALYVTQDNLLNQALAMPISSNEQFLSLLKLWHQVAINEVALNDARLTDLLVLKIYEYLMESSSQSNLG